MPGETWLSSNDNNAWLFAFTGGSLLALDIVLPLPSSIIGTLLGARLGLLPGFCTTFVGLMVGQFAGYLLGRLLLARADPDLPKVPTLMLVFLSRPVPILAEAMAVAAGASSMPFAQFAWTCAAGNLIYSAVLAANGATLLPDSLAGPALAIPMILPVATWILWMWTERRLRNLHKVGDK
ncbi:MAG: VTT domain-containing protein [Gammaproteobacteria bacterium]|nr:VTT domain-containing protein [Gammaproteobacteria bacterium]